MVVSQEKVAEAVGLEPAKAPSRYHSILVTPTLSVALTLTLVVPETWMRGWKAYTQRRKVPVHPGPRSLLQVDVPAGDWYVTLRYEPAYYRTGKVVSSSAVAALIGLLIAGMRRSKMAIS